MRHLFTAAVLLLAAHATAAERGGPLEWRYVGADQAHTKYSLADDITAANVGELAIAWRWEPNEKPLDEYGTRPGRFQATPIMVDDVLYLSTMYTRAAALDAQTGTELWTFDPKAYEGGPRGARPRGFQHRGVAYWREGEDTRIFLNSRDRLYAVDARTGELVAGFGAGGSVLLTEGHGRPVSRHEFDQTSPPVVFEDLVIVGSRIPDQVQRKFDPPGTVQAFDARTGKRRWVFFTIPQASDDFGADTWGGDSWRYTGHGNVWGFMSLDPDRGLLYLPTSTPSGDYWGGRRPGANLFADSLVCLDARTGERQWHFQAVHHGVWDYDFSAPPNLVTITVDGREIDAVAEVSKQGFTYVFDRITGEPVWPIEERPVDTDTDVPGEMLYPTQPFPTKPPPFSGQGVSLADANDLTPAIRELAMKEMRRFRLGPLFTPPSLRGSLQRAPARPAAPRGAARRSTRKPGCSTYARRKVPTRTRYAPMRATIRRSTWRSATTARTARRSSCSTGPPAPRRRPRLLAISARFRSSSRRTRTWWQSTSTPGRSRGRCRSARAAPRCATTPYCGASSCRRDWVHAATRAPC